MKLILFTVAIALFCVTMSYAFDRLPRPRFGLRIANRKQQEEDRKRQEEYKKRQEERKLVRLIYDSAGERMSMYLSRDIFSDWNKMDKYIFDLNGNACPCYDDVVPGESYFIVQK